MILYHFFFKIYIFYTRIKNIFEKFSFIKYRVTDSIRTIGTLLKRNEKFSQSFSYQAYLYIKY
jgi:hypothetical protein